MNYSKVLTNPKFAPKPNSAKRSPSSDFALVKPFTRMIEKGGGAKPSDGFPSLYKKSDFVLTTMPKEERAQLVYIKYCFT